MYCSYHILSTKRCGYSMPPLNCLNSNLYIRPAHGKTLANKVRLKTEAKLGSAIFYKVLALSHCQSIIIFYSVACRNIHKICV